MKSHYSTITSKGQVTIPSSIREKLHLGAGSKVEYIMHDNCIIMVPINSTATKLKGILPKPIKSLSIEEMNNAIREVR